MLKKYHRFLQKNRNKGMPNFITFLCIANAILYFYTLISKDFSIAMFLDFDAERFFAGEVWRAVTWVLVDGVSYVGERFGFIYIFFYILFNRWLEQVLVSVWGSLRANIYYIGGAVLSLLTAIVIWLGFDLPMLLSLDYVNFSLMLAVATLVPEERILLFGILPLKMRWLAILDLVLIAMPLYRVLVSTPLMLRTESAMYFLTMGKAAVVLLGAPVISVLNYLLHFGREALRLLPFVSSAKQRKRRREFQRKSQPNPDWAANYRSKTGEKPYRHKCTVCGRTDTENSGLEFRYCSRCKGYFCYCIEHIQNHEHIQ